MSLTVALENDAVVVSSNDILPVTGGSVNFAFSLQVSVPLLEINENCEKIDM